MPSVSQRHRPTDATLPAPWYYAWPWVVGMDDDVAVDVAAHLAEGESVTLPAATLTLLGDTAARDAEASPAALVGAPRVNGTKILQRLSGLAAGGLYRLTVLHGPAGNRRGAGLLIEVAA